MDLQNGFAIAIAWPEFMGKQAGSWYDPLMRLLRFNKNFHYQVGHASLILINAEGNCHYFDCGRYEAPYQKGRIRDVTTDCGLHIKTQAQVKDGQISNIKDILTEVQLNESCKGFGTLRSAYCPIHFESAYSHVKKVQEKGIISFGPFVRPGTNCCRFVQQAFLNGKPEARYFWRLKLLFPLLPKPITLVRILPNSSVVQAKEKLAGYKDVSQSLEQLIDTRYFYDKTNVKSTLRAPLKPGHIPENSQWLGGEMAGSWFHMIQTEHGYKISRYSENGSRKCQGYFRLKNHPEFDIQQPYRFTYLTHCSRSAVIQNKKTFEFVRIAEAMEAETPQAQMKEPLTTKVKG